MMDLSPGRLILPLVSLLLPAAELSASGGFSDAMMDGLNGASTRPVLTIGESLPGGYLPPGKIDGLGAYPLKAGVVRVLANHELSPAQAYPYTLAGGTALTGGRISYFDMDSETRRVLGGGLAYTEIHDRGGRPLSAGGRLPARGLNRLCSAQLVEAADFGDGRGFADRIFFAGEETRGGTLWALDTARMQLWAVPAVGRGAWENVTPVDTGRQDLVALLMGDDRAGAPLYLYVGRKGLDRHDRPDNGFLARNGLANGVLYVWVAATADSPQQFHGTGNRMQGSWLALRNAVPGNAGAEGWDELGFAEQETLDEQVRELGAFRFSRPEDLATNPGDGGEVVFSATGRAKLFSADAWGTLYKARLQFGALGEPLATRLEILYDGDDPAHRDAGLRSPDNLEWADDGALLVQEDRSYKGFGRQSGEEASIWRFDAAITGRTPLRVGQMNRHAIPAGQVDRDPGDLGDWESSGILDVSALFDASPGRLFLFSVQAHSLKGGAVDARQLDEGGQLLFLDIGAP